MKITWWILSLSALWIYMQRTNLSGASIPCSSNNGGCSHFCVPKNSSHECTCPIGLTLKKNRKTCEDKVNKFILFTDAEAKSTNMILLDVNHSVSRTLYKDPGFHFPLALDFDPVEDRVYYTDLSQGRIMSAFRNASSAKIVYFCNVVHPVGLAIDHVGRNVYWTDDGTDRIEIGRLDGTKRKVLFKDGLDKPGAIVLDEINGLIYWTDLGANPKIEKATTDGSNRQSIVTESIVWPSGLTIDHVTNHLYWTDNFLATIEMSDPDGGSRHVILSSEDNIKPFRLALYKNVLFWTDWNRKSILSYNLTNRKQETVVRDLQKPMDIHVYDPSMSYSGPSRNAQNTWVCSDFLLPKPGGFNCACPTGVALKSDGKSCDNDPFNEEKSKKFMMFADAITGEIYSVAISVSESPCESLKIKRNMYIYIPEAVDYDPIEGKVYWVTQGLVARAFPNGSSAEVVAERDVWNPMGLAVDYVGRKVYWTDLNTSNIEVASLDGSSRRSLVALNLTGPNAIILNIPERKLFWTDGKFPSKIEKANMDGSAREILLSSAISWFVSLALDYSSRVLYWCDMKQKKIGSMDLQGNNQMVILDLSSGDWQPFGLAFSDNVIYWSDRKNGSINKHDMSSSLDEVLVHGMGLPGKLYIHDSAEVFSESTSCSTFNGNCSHLCLPNPRGNQCFCPEGVALKPNDPFTCLGVSRCPQLSAPLHGSLQPCSNLPGYTCQFSCDRGYVIVGSATRTCIDNGTWSGVETQCNVINCSKLMVSQGDPLRMSSCGNHYGAQCNFSCPLGYRLNGSSSLTCVTQGDSLSSFWNKRLPTCHAVNCGPLIPPTHAIISPSTCLTSSTYNQTCRYSCPPSGYVLSGSSSRVCGNDGNWTGFNNTRCRLINCSKLVVSQGDPLRVSGCGSHYGAQCNFSCPIGYRLNGSSSLKCVAQGDSLVGFWDKGLPTCHVSYDEKKPNIEDGTLHYKWVVGILAGTVFLIVIIVSFIYIKKLRGPCSERPPLTTNQFTGVAFRNQSNHGNIHCEDIESQPTDCSVTFMDSIAFHSSGFEIDAAGHNNGNSSALDLKYTAEAEGFFDSTGGVLNAAPNSDVQIDIGNGALVDGNLQRIFFRVILDETGLLRDVLDEMTLISPVIECGPHDINFLKPVEIIFPHCLYSKEIKERWISVYRTDPGSIKWEKVPSESDKTDQSKAWFITKQDAIHIKTVTFSLWSIFACRGPMKKRATVFSSKPDPTSDLIYLRFYVYNDNEDSRKQVEMRDEQRFCESKRSREKPFKLCDDSKWLKVKITNIEEGWKLDKTNAEQIYHCNKANGRGFRAADALDIIVKPKKGREVNGFSCKIKFQQDGDEVINEIYVNPGFPPLKKLESVNSPRQNSKEDNVLEVTAGSSISSALKEGRRDNFGKKSKQDSKLLSSLQDSDSYLERVCNRLDRKKKSGVSGFHRVCSHYDIDEDKVAAVFEKYQAGPSRALLEYLAASQPQLTVADFATVLRKIAKRHDVAELLEEYDKQ